MDLLNIIEEIEKVDPEFQDRISPRRAAIKNITSFGSKVAVAALPFALGSLFKKAYGQTTAVIGTVLNYALQLEFLEANFYNAGLDGTAFATMRTTLNATTETPGLRLIQTDEQNHVKFLQSVLTSLGITPVSFTAANFDFTAKGTFPTVYTSSDTFLALSHVFEDTGVRAYKGAAPAFLRNQTLLTAALNIHSVEARHASHIRALRRARGGAGAAIRPWITGANDTGVTAAAASYINEDNVTQGGVNVATGLSAYTAIAGTNAMTSATQAFDEPLDMTSVVNIVTPFFVK